MIDLTNPVVIPYFGTNEEFPIVTKRRKKRSPSKQKEKYTKIIDVYDVSSDLKA